jgi:hypothetical protein
MCFFVAAKYHEEQSLRISAMRPPLLPDCSEQVPKCELLEMLAFSLLPESVPSHGVAGLNSPLKAALNVAAPDSSTNHPRKLVSCSSHSPSFSTTRSSASPPVVHDGGFLDVASPPGALAAIRSC